MDKLSVTDIDPHMRDVRPTCIKEDEVPFLQVFFFNGLAEPELLSGRPGKGGIKNLINLLDEGRTINPSQSGPSQTVGDSQKVLDHPDKKVSFL